MRIYAASMDCGVSAATAVVTCCAGTNELKRAAAAASNIDPLGLYITVVLLAINTFWVGAKFGPSSPRLAFA